MLKEARRFRECLGVIWMAILVITMFSRTWLSAEGEDLSKGRVGHDTPTTQPRPYPICKLLCWRGGKFRRTP
jgi:hypothetical protein